MEMEDTKAEIKKPTLDEIMQAQTPNGGWTKEVLAKWGVSWPPPKGWKKRLISQDEV